MHQETNAKDDTQKKIFTIPNLMSLFRLCLIPVIIWLYCVEKNDVAERLNKAAKEKYGIDNFTDMIADETVATDEEALMAFLQEKNHPVLGLDPIM